MHGYIYTVYTYPRKVFSGQINDNVALTRCEPETHGSSKDAFCDTITPLRIPKTWDLSMARVLTWMYMIHHD